jgi:hypothetical protein
MRYVGKERDVETTPDELNAWLGKETGKVMRSMKPR